jgi:hypothetical protein
MNATLLALAMLAQPESMVSHDKMQLIAEVIIEQSDNPLLLGAVVLAETGGRNVIARKRGKHKMGCDVGVFQIHCPNCSDECIKNSRGVDKGARLAIQILDVAKSLCLVPPSGYKRVCRRGYWARYNPGSPRWARRVKDIWGRLKAWAP